MPENRVVKISAVWTQKDDIADGIPSPRRRLLHDTPYAIPSVPSTICAINPQKRQIRKILIISYSL